MTRFARRGLAPAVAALALVTGPAHALPSCESAPCASDRDRPILLLSYYRQRDLRKLIVATERAGLPPDTPVYYGGYWGKELVRRTPLPGPPPAGPKRPRPEMPGRRYSPMFSLAPTQFWTGRSLPAAHRSAAAGAAPSRYSGHLPWPGELKRVSGTVRYRWGLELGRRYRDRIRHRRARGDQVVTWQLDELVSEIAGRGGHRRRQFVAGVMRGLTYGRPPLGDTKLPGIVWATGRAMELAGRPGLDGFWRTVDDCALYLVGEEYPTFTGSPGRAARRHAAWPARMSRGGGARRRLARRYVAGMTPGHRVSPGLGGNVHGRSRSYVQRWRVRYVRARALSRPAGLAQYNFTFENARWHAVSSAVGATARGLRLMGRP